MTGFNDVLIGRHQSSIEKLRDFFVGKDSVYKENWTLLHITIEEINQCDGDGGYEVKATVHETPGFTSTDDTSYIFSPVFESDFNLEGSGFGYGTIRRVESVDALKKHHELLNPGHAWPRVSLNRIDHAEELNVVYRSVIKNNKYLVLKEFIHYRMRNNELPELISIADQIIGKASAFIEWPQRSILFMPDTIRDKKFFDYNQAQIDQLKAAGIQPDKRSNGPAIMAFLLAGGTRPTRLTGHGWSIHHIYDGKFPISGMSKVCHAVKHPQHFTKSAGLVALHPVADGLASESPYFAWYLRLEALRRFDYYPKEFND